MRSFFSFLMAFLVFTSCAHKGNKTAEVEPATEKESVIPTVESVDDGENPFVSNARTNAGKRTPVVLVNFGPGLYGPIAYIGALKSLETKSIKVHAVSGVELGALVAALYAKKGKAATVEWEFYKLFKNNNEVIYSEPWKKELKSRLRKVFGKDVIQDYKIQLFLPVFDENQKDWRIMSRGDTYNTLVKSMGLNDSLEFTRISASQTLFNDQLWVKRGMDIPITLNILTKKMNFKFFDSDKSVQYSKIVGRYLNNQTPFKNKVDVDLGPKEIDDIKNLPDFLKAGEDEGKSVADEVSQKIQSWE